MADWPTPADIVRELAATREQLVQAVTELRLTREQQTALAQDLADHDKRLSRLEKARAYMTGAISILAFIVTVGVPLLVSIGG